MNALRSTFTYAAIGALLSTVSVDSLAEIPGIELAPSHVESYIQCIQAAYASNSWHSTTVAECRSRYPAVLSLRRGDYVALTFTTAQSKTYDQSWKRWVDFDKSLRSLILSKGLSEMFSAARVQTAYSFRQVATDLDTRFSELDSPPFSWYPATKTSYKTATGMSLEQLHAAELNRFSSCLATAINTLDVKTATHQSVEIKAAACIRDITQMNSDVSQGLYNAGDFSRVSGQHWTQIASAQASAKEAERVRLEQEKANSWPVKLKALAGQALVFALVFVGLFVAYRFLRNLPSAASHDTGGEQVRRQPQRRRRHTEDDEETEYEPPRATRPSTPSPQRSPDLGTFTLRHQKVCSLATQHMCASCRWWAGERTPHPVTPDLYVKIGTLGKCIHKHPGSPYGMKKHNAGTTCKDFHDLGL
ncbi:MAG: hypothetical protein ACRER3_19955 [Pseudomonas fluorescens]